MIEAIVLAAATVVPPAQDAASNKPAAAVGKPWVPLSEPKTKKLKKKFKGDSLRARSKRLGCKSNRRFRIENSWGFINNVKLTGRCATWHFKKIDVVHTRHGHHPSASKALDLMTNTRGSCSADRQTGDWLFKYLRNNWNRFGIRYVIWENKYYPSKYSGGRYMGRPGCTHGHYDHIHVAFN